MTYRHEREAFRQQAATFKVSDFCGQGPRVRPAAEKHSGVKLGRPATKPVSHRS